MNSFRDSIGELVAEGRRLGTAWIASKDLAVTAWHCVRGLAPNAVGKIRFSTKELDFKVEFYNEQADFAALRIIASHGLMPLRMMERPSSNLTNVAWKGHGYPSALNEHRIQNDGMHINGTIDSLFESLNNEPSIQLRCNQSLNVKPDQTIALSGISGSPVIVTHGDTDFVIGFVRETPLRFGEAILYATPLDRIVATLESQRVAIQLDSWDRFRRFPVIRQFDDGTFLSNIDARLVKSLWEEGIAGFWCNVRYDESRLLSNAIERLLIHAPSLATRKSVELKLAGGALWETCCLRHIADWVPLHSLRHNELVRQFSFLDLDGDKLPSGGQRFESAEKLALHIQRICNDWVLNCIRDRLSEAFADPEAYLDFKIAPDVLTAMQSLWVSWRRELENDPKLLHHFLGLMLTGDGNFDMHESGGGVGPVTSDRCVIEPIAYTLAICTGLSTEFHLPKAGRPGNLGVEGLDGHACGIELLRGRTLNSVDRAHQWRTAIVMLPFLQNEWPAFEKSHVRLDASTTGRSLSLSKEPPGPVVLPKDRELQLAIATGISELKKVLTRRCGDLAHEQKLYVNGSSDVQA